MKFKHYATDEIKEVKVLSQSVPNEMVAEDVKTREICILEWDDNRGKWKIKKTSFHLMD